MHSNAMMFENKRHTVLLPTEAFYSSRFTRLDWYTHFRVGTGWFVRWKAENDEKRSIETKWVKEGSLKTELL